MRTQATQTDVRRHAEQQLQQLQQLRQLRTLSSAQKKVGFQGLLADVNLMTAVNVFFYKTAFNILFRGHLLSKNVRSARSAPDFCFAPNTNKILIDNDIY